MSAEFRVITQGQLEGDFEGCDGETIFRFTNRQVWKRAHYAYNYHYAFMPRARIIQQHGRYVLEVDGTNDRIEVERIDT